MGGLSPIWESNLPFESRILMAVAALVSRLVWIDFNMGAFVNTGDNNSVLRSYRSLR